MRKKSKTHFLKRWCDTIEDVGFRSIRASLEFDVLGKGALEGRDQVGVHEGVIVGDVEAMDWAIDDGFGEALAENVAMFAFHDEDDVGPSDKAGGDGNSGGGFGAGGANGVSGKVFENFFGGATAPFVAAANEEELGGVVFQKN